MEGKIQSMECFFLSDIEEMSSAFLFNCLTYCSLKAQGSNLRIGPVSAPTIRSVAKVAKVSTATVSMAMRNDPRITLEVREHVQKLAKKFSHAVCALWYPIKDRTTTQRHVETIANMGWKKIMLAEFIYAPPQRSDRLNGCGMLLINAPWQLDQWLTALIPALHQALQQPNCGSLVEVMGES